MRSRWARLVRLTSRFSRGCRLFAVNQPRYPESIDDLAEPQRPEGLRDSYLDRSLFCQSIEDALCLRGVLGPEHHTKALRLLVLPRHRITALQHAVTRGEPDVQDLLGPPRRR